MTAPLTRDAFSFLGEGVRDRAAERLPDGPRHAGAVRELVVCGFIEREGPGGYVVTDRGRAYYGDPSTAWHRGDDDVYAERQERALLLARLAREADRETGPPPEPAIWTGGQWSDVPLELLQARARGR